MIGGFDIFVPFDPRPDDIRFVFGLLRSLMRDALLEDVASDASAPRPLGQSIPSERGEYLVYRDLTSYLSWSTHGATDSNGAGLVHVIVASDGMTFVVDAPDSATARSIRDIISSLERNRSARAGPLTFRKKAA